MTYHPCQKELRASKRRERKKEKSEREREKKRKKEKKRGRERKSETLEHPRVREEGSIDRSVKQQSHYLLRTFEHKVNRLSYFGLGIVLPEVKEVTLYVQADKVS